MIYGKRMRELKYEKLILRKTSYISYFYDIKDFIELFLRLFLIFNINTSSIKYKLCDILQVYSII